MDGVERGEWQSVLYDLSRDQRQPGEPFHADPRMADWQYFLPLDGSQQVLVFGVGWGTIPVALSGTCRRVYAVDPAPQRLAFLKARLCQQRISNVTLIQARDLSALPFAGASFDLITLVDQTAQVHREPASLRDALQTAHSLLKESGAFCLAAGNRLGFHRLLGRRKSAGDRSLHTLQGYRRLLMKVGFSTVESYAPLPFYDGIPLFYLPLGQGPVMSFFLRNVFPLFEAVSPEVKRSYALEYAVARAVVRLTLRCRLERLISLFLSGFILVARREGGETRVA